MWELTIAVLIFVLSTFLVIKKPKYSLYVLIVLSVLLHKELFSLYKWDLMPIRAFMLGVLVAGLFKIYSQIVIKKDFQKIFEVIKDPVVLSMFFLWLIRGVSLYFSLNLQASLFMFAFFTTVIFLLGITYLHLKNNPDEVLGYLKFFILVAFLLTVFGYIQILVNRFLGVTIGALWTIPGNIPRVGSLFWDVNHYGALLAALIPFSLVFALLAKNLKEKYYYLLVSLSFMANLFLTNSRSAWIMCIVSIFLFVCLQLVKFKGLRSLFFVFLLLLGLTIPVLWGYSIKSSPFRTAIKQYFHYRLDSFDSHFLLLTGTYQIFEKYPYLGGGYGSFFEQFGKTKVAPTYFGRDPAALNTRVPAHSIWGELLAETGVFGLLGFVAVLVFFILPSLYSVFNSSEKKIYLVSTAIPAVILGWLIAGIFYSYNSEYFWILMFLFASWGMGTLVNKISVKEVFIHYFWRERTITIFLTVLAAGLIFIGLGNNHLIPWDEAIYAQVSKNMLVSDDYASLYWVPNKIWFEKPPLGMWSMVLAMRALGVNSWGAKLPSALLGFSLVIATYFFTKKYLGRVAAFFSALALLTTTQFLYYSRMAMFDVSVTFYLSVSLYLYYHATLSKKNFIWILSGLFIGLAVMVKGVVGLLPLPVIALYETYLVISRQNVFSLSLIKKYLLLIVSMLAVSFPWHLHMYVKYGYAFIDNYITYHVFDRALSSIEDKGRPFWWYLVVLKVSMRIWFVGLLGALPLFLIKGFRKSNFHIFISFWAIVVFLFFSAAKSKLIWYIIPLYPAVSIMVGYFVGKVIEVISSEAKQEHNKRMLTIVLVMGISIFSLFYLFLNRKLVYPSDLTGSQARLLQQKDRSFGTESLLYVDRMEIPLQLFYSDGPTRDVDFSATKSDRVPSVDYAEQLILLTKKGRFSEHVVGYDYAPIVEMIDGDWMLWYMKSKYQVDSEALLAINERMKALLPVLHESQAFKDEYKGLVNQKAVLESRIIEKLGHL